MGYNSKRYFQCLNCLDSGCTSCNPSLNIRATVSAWQETPGALVHPTLAKAVKDTNPKDAIGDAKAPLWLLSPIAKVKWAMAQFAGQIKYGAWNWRAAGVRTSVYLSAMERHMEAYKSGEDLDPVDGTHHLGNIMACCAILMDAAAAHKLTDDRPPRVDHRPTIIEAEALMAKLKVQYADRNPRHYTIADSIAPATLDPSTQGEHHAAQNVPANGPAPRPRPQGREAGTEEA